jgi:ribosomal protein S18 acetylase RimI-like enzyme
LTDQYDTIIAVGSKEQPSCTGIILGFATMRTTILQSTMCRRKHTDMYLSTFGVHPQARRCGLGSALLDQLDQLAQHRACKTISLHVLDTNANAIALYQKHGFTVEAILPNHYNFNGKYHNALHLVKYIQKSGSVSVSTPSSLPWCMIQ